MAELSDERSQEVADILKMSMGILQMLDVDYCREAVKAFRKQASFQDAASVINGNYNPKRTTLLYKQADALEALCNYLDRSRQCSELKAEIQQEQKDRDEMINRLFL
jgi:hypothetical protein